MTKEFILLSSGRRGDIVYQLDSIEDCLAAAKEEILKGQECAAYVKHSDLSLPSVEIKKTQRQLDVEQAIEEALAIRKPEGI